VLSRRAKEEYIYMKKNEKNLKVSYTVYNRFWTFWLGK